jgi:hypothetical protein
MPPPAGIIYEYQSNPAMTLETWHEYSLPFGVFAYDRARVTPQSYWLPTVVTYGGPKGKIPNSPIQSTTITRWEAEDFIVKQLERGLAVEVWDQTPTCLTKQIFAAGPCSPLTCDIGRPMRGAGPRYK